MRFLLRSVVFFLGGLVLVSALSLRATRTAAAPSWIVFSAQQNGIWNIYRMTDEGDSVTRLTDFAGNKTWDKFYPVWSPDGRWIAFGYLGDIFRMQVDGGALSQLTILPSHEDRPVWSPDGTTIGFVATRGPRITAYQMAADGSRLEELVGNSDPDEYHYPAVEWVSVWEDERQRSPDGLWTVVTQDGSIFRVPAVGGSAERLTPPEMHTRTPAWSPWQAGVWHIERALLVGIALGGVVFWDMRRH